MSFCIKISFLKYPTVVAIAGVVLAIIPTVCIFCDVLTAIAKRRFSGKSSSESDIYKQVSHFKSTLSTLIAKNNFPLYLYTVLQIQQRKKST